jgi:hypothetical protein
MRNYAKCLWPLVSFVFTISLEILEETMGALSCNTEVGLFSDILSEMYQM